MKRFALAGLLFLPGCFTARYLTQAALGQAELIQTARPISRVLEDRRIDARTRHLLAQVSAIKAWGQARGLKPTKNYDRYSDLHRPAAVWVVQACAPLKFDVRHWQFPIAGTVPYLGFFDEKAAQAYAAQVAEEEQLDVTVRTASAYSTLGWFRDPVLSTMLSPGDEALGDLVNVILHESVHATFYVPGQSAFNESAASFVADALTAELLTDSFGKGAWLARAWVQDQARGDRITQRLRETFEALDALYKSDKPDADKLAEKARILGAVQKELRLRRPLNNASLAGFRTYSSGTAGFERLRKACETWPRTVAALASLTGKDFDAPQQDHFDPVLDRLRARECP